MDGKLIRLGRAARPAMLAGVGLVLAACATVPDGILLPVAAPSSNSRVDMLVATTRAYDQDPGVLFTGDRGSTLAFANLVVSIPPRREVGSVQWPRRAPGDPATEFVVTDVRRLQRGDLANWFRSSSGSTRRLFVYVHGFNTRFDRAVFRFAQLAHDTDASAAPVLFSWPSRGRVLDYRRDLDNASHARSDLANLLTAAIRSPDVAEIVVLAHSMGSWVAMEAVKQVALQQRGVSPKITNLVLASPDLDVGVFRRQVEDMGPRRPQITLFVSQVDRALRASALLAAGATRLGAIDPSQQEYQHELGNLPRVSILDVTALRAGDRFNHSVYSSSPAIVRLIGDRLIEGQVIADPEGETSLTVIESLGTAASLVVTAPIRVFDAARDMGR